MSYRTDLESTLKKAPSNFHTIDDLELAAQFVSDAIKTAFEINCPVKPKYTPAPGGVKSSQSVERVRVITRGEKDIQQGEKNQNHHRLEGF